MTENTFEVVAVQRLAEQIGYGNLMWIASALWRRKMVRAYGEGYETGAFVPVTKNLVKDEWKDNLHKEMKFMDRLVEMALDDDRTTHSNNGVYIVGKERPEAENVGVANADRIAEAVERTKKYLRR